MIESQDPFLAFKAEMWLYQSSRTFTDMSDMSYVVVTGTIGRGSMSALPKCVNSLPPKQSLLFNVSLCFGTKKIWRMFGRWWKNLTLESEFYVVAVCDVYQCT